MNLSWASTVFSSEIKKMLSYRVDFWLQFPALVLIQIFLAYFLWDSIFESRGASELGGYSFHGLMLYYLMAPLMDRILRGVELRFMSFDIYEGTLSRYLIYPVSFFLYKYIQHAAQSFISFLQFAVMLSLFAVIFHVPEEISLTLTSFLTGMMILVSASLMYFILASIFECIAFWADNVWSLMVMLRLTIFFLGGGMIPLNFFPDWSLEVLLYTPFPYMTYFPIRAFFGYLSVQEFYAGMTVIGSWILILSLSLRLIWKRGLLVYSGVGM
ncbi:MAG: ABC-2 family transporter protein [Spirochaetia bacterium]|nr:ABC-2 family transporter protein [Spirochaetia bacterium]